MIRKYREEIFAFVMGILVAFLVTGCSIRTEEIFSDFAKDNETSLAGGFDRTELTRNERIFIKEVLRKIENSNEEMVTVSRGLNGDYEHALEIIEIIENYIQADLCYDGVEKYDRITLSDLIYKDSETIDYCKLVLKPVETRQMIEECRLVREECNKALNEMKITKDTDKKEAVRRIAIWVSEHLQYKEQTYNYPLDGFRTGEGVCMTYALMFEELCDMIEINNRYIIGTADGGEHGWNAVEIDGTWYYVDVTWYDGNKNSRFLLSENLWSSHKIDKVYEYRYGSYKQVAPAGD